VDRDEISLSLNEFEYGAALGGGLKNGLVPIWGDSGKQRMRRGLRSRRRGATRRAWSRPAQRAGERSKGRIGHGIRDGEAEGREDTTLARSGVAHHAISAGPRGAWLHGSAWTARRTLGARREDSGTLVVP